MINLGPNSSAASPAVPVTSIKVIGVGGAGLALIERLTALDLGLTKLIASGTDAQALLASSAEQKIQLGRERTKGLGAGGDPSVGEGAARESAEEICSACSGAEMVIVCAGLGGGTGSGAAPVVAAEAKKNGALVLGLVTLPFRGEGGKRRKQAEVALSRLSRPCTAVLCFENERMSAHGAADVPVAEAFSASAEVMASAVLALVRMVTLPAVLRLGVDELLQVFHGADARCQFGHGTASGADRVHVAVEQALQSPLLDSGSLLADAESVLVHVTGSASLRLSEVKKVLAQLSVHIEDSAEIMLGVATDGQAGNAISVSIMACARSSGGLLAAEEVEEDEVVTTEENMETSVENDGQSEDKEKNPVQTKRRKVAVEQTQEELPLDQAMRGRFKDLDPTMVDGQDLDIPTFIRMRLRLK
ncbi:MAG: cell division protein FtsZ [Chthoniobacterales bacterium]|jgi:cell division protein FtsZ